MLPSEDELTDFLEDVSSVSRLLDGLEAGTITPEYVDQKIAQRSEGKCAAKSFAPAAAKQTASNAADAAVDRDAAATDTAKQAELLRKVEELKANRQRKVKARQQYESYVQGKKQQQHSYATDYNQWELWCPSDEEDELFSSLTPNSPQFRAMEQDISKRHARMVEQRQIAERQRQLGNDAFKAGQFSEALRCYELGLEAQRHNMTLHANAAMAALKLKCYVAAQEHCDKVLHLAEVLHNTPKHPLCVKALQRRAAAHQGLGQHSKAVEDLQTAADILPGDVEVLEQLTRAKVLLEEHKTAKQLARLVLPKPTQPQQQVSMPEQAPSGNSEASSSCSSGSSTATGGSSDRLIAAANNATADTVANTSVSAPSKHSSTDSSGANSDVVRLKRIKQLIDGLNSLHSSSNSSATPGSAQEEATAAARATGVAAADCEELLGLLREPQHRIFFRNSDGVAAVSKLVNKSATAEPNNCLAGHAFNVLNAAWDSDTALEQLSDQIVGAALDFITSQHAATSSSQQDSSTQAQSSQSGRAAAAAAEVSDRQKGLSAALNLLYSASMCSAVRSKLCAQLVKPAARQQQQQQQQGRGVGQQGSSRLLGLWEVCCNSSYAEGRHTVIRVTALSLLSNCMLVAAARNAMLQLLQQQEAQHLLADLTQLLGACSPSTAVKVFGLLSNMCNHTGLRVQLAACQPLVQQLLQAAAKATAPLRAAQPAQAGSEYALAVLGCLCNLSLEQKVQQTMAEQDVLVAQLLRLAAAGPKGFRCADTRRSSSSSGGGRAGSKPTAGPKLPPRGKAQNTDSSNTNDSAVMSVRGATLLSRVAKQSGGVTQLQHRDVLGVLASAMAECLTVLQDGSGAQKQQQETPSSKVFETAAEWLSAVVRTMALITAAPGACSSCSADTASAVITACCQLLRDCTIEDAAKGNAALVIKSFAADSKQQWHPVLAKADAVAALITAARAGKGSPSSKNAGIALAVLARAGGSFIERLRELRGLEVLYEYVKP